MVHSVSQFWTAGCRGKHVGVTGDATEAGNMLTAVALQEQKTWTLVKKTISCDFGALVAEVDADPTVKKKFWTCTTTLGYKDGESRGGQGQQNGTTGDANTALANAVGQGVARVMLQQGMNHIGGSPTQRSSGGKDSKEVYDMDDKSMLMGLSHVTKFRFVPIVWMQILNKRPETVRKILMELMTEAAFNNQVTIKQTFCIEEKNMKDIQKGQFNVGPVATYNLANDSLTPLICWVQSAAEQAFLVKKEAAMAETIRTCMLEDALAKPKYNPKFPDNFHDLKTMVDTFMIMIWVLFGECSPLYIQLHQVSQLLNECQVQMTARAYSKASCYRIMWTTYEEVWQFFDQGLLAEAFR
jgi:hypothetical protein